METMKETTYWVTDYRHLKAKHLLQMGKHLIPIDEIQFIGVIEYRDGTQILYCPTVIRRRVDIFNGDDMVYYIYAPYSFGSVCYKRRGMAQRIADRLLR